MTGWLKDGDSIYYCALDGARQTGWQEIDGSWYFFDENGVMQKDWKQIGDQTFYFGDNGIMRIGWQEIDGNWYALLNPRTTSPSSMSMIRASGRKPKRKNPKSDGFRL